MKDSVMDAALGDLFADPLISTSIAYYPLGGGAALNLRAILRRPDLVMGFGEGKLATATTVVDMRMEDLATPQSGDRLEIDGAMFVVQGEPLADPNRLIWTLNTRPE